MKRIIIILGAAVLSAMMACNEITPDTEPEDPDNTTEPVKPEPAVVTDTAIFICGLEYPESYDWIRDTAYGRVNASIVLLKGCERLLTINTGGSTGISSSEDRHHLIRDHIYTENHVGRNTVIGCDGHDIFSYKGREVLRGLLVQGEDVYTLGQDMEGKGFSYRKNGEAVIAKTEGTVMGQMSSNPFYRSGALYLDDGHICFCYGTEDSDGSFTWTLVSDGTEKELKPRWSSSELFDIRVIGGEVFWLRCKPGSRECILVNGATETRIGGAGYASKRGAIGKDRDGGVVVSGLFQNGGRQWSAGFWTPAKGFRIMIGESYHYLLDGEWGHVSYLDDGSITMNCPMSPSIRIPGDGYFYHSFRNAYPAGDRLVLGLNPVKQGKAPGFWLDRKWHELDLNGFVTDVQAELTTRTED